MLLGMGGGKEAIYFAKAGFRVTGIDFIEKMVAKAMENARQRNVEIQGKVQEISRLDFKPACFDVVWYSCSIYSSIPGRKTRIEMLKRVGDWLTQGNIRSEKGDILKDNIEFLHAFSSRIELESEFTDAGFEMVYSHFPQDVINGGALLRKKK